MFSSWFIAYAINWLSIASQFSSKLNPQQCDDVGFSFFFLFFVLSGRTVFFLNHFWKTMRQKRFYIKIASGNFDKVLKHFNVYLVVKWKCDF